MKKIEAIIRLHLLDKVKDALVSVGVQGMTITEVQGCGRCKGQNTSYRGTEYKTGYVNRLKIEIALDEEILEEALDAIMTAARTEGLGDGKIFISDLESAIRIRTGEYNYNAV
ncbi:MAG TPA: P-II family nitrogen regulator [Pyrinomonadaceae bacterium]|jgi:nitrogen regulatory protein P-II 1